MNVNSTSNAKKGPHDNFNSYKDFSDIELNSQIACATMEHFNMKEFEGIALVINTYMPLTHCLSNNISSNDAQIFISVFLTFVDNPVPDEIAKGSDQEKREWLYTNIETIIEK